jgi:hypothetical protein
MNLAIKQKRKSIVTASQYKASSIEEAGFAAEL